MAMGGPNSLSGSARSLVRECNRLTEFPSSFVDAVPSPGVSVPEGAPEPAVTGDTEYIYIYIYI